ncbi:MBL fold metallo-hydrolase [Polaromonas sp.]|uniref:MBL fold metallo-hydrolase n=1 Tax=Polaromonas sp. TaxID=1869339 RepID=UPI00248887AA|nr:MBL fold metallo-hydrolase [Polaromonas sp.]MDI1338702.1 MBL fold metallo-hydrolase [Polaromonas sp.]
MKITQIRSATLIVEYAGKRFLVDPMLAPKDTYPGFPGTPNNHLRNPTVELVTPMADILAVDAVIVTHTHPDHWDHAAQALIPKTLPVFVQDASDAEIVQSAGFNDVRILREGSSFEGIALTKTQGQHGSDVAVAAIGALLGEVSGVIFKHPDEKTVYLAGDTVWNDFVKSNLVKYLPDVVILNSGDAQFLGHGPIIMNKDDVLSVHLAARNATLVATHMEAVNHALLKRTELRAFAAEQGMAHCLHVPEDGEAFTI